MSERRTPIFKNDRTTFERLEKFVSKEYFTDCNLRGKLYGDEVELTTISHVDFFQTRVSFEEAKSRLNSNPAPVKTGFSFGPTWSTHWFKLTFDIPEAFRHKRVHLVWDTGSEAMIWSGDGEPLQGLSGDAGRTDFRMQSSLRELYVEVACNSLFGAGNNGFINPPDANKSFTLKTAKLAVFREQVYQLLMDFDVLIGLCKTLKQEDPKKYDVMFFANQLVNKYIENSNTDALKVLHDEASKFLHSYSTSSENSKIFEVHAVANCHIDSAWLWPFDETKRKCARSWANVVALTDEYPTLLKFACSQAQQLDWVRNLYPSLYTKIVEMSNRGSFVPVGGCWVEMDGYLPGGESFARQMLYGQKFFSEHFGKLCTEFWLPDTFGYSAQLPQLSSLAGMSRFVTQKLSWNLVNKFPHHTFWWTGIDGTRILAHLPSGDSYCMQVNVDDVEKTVSNFRDKGRSNGSLLLYGHGDGGGGPDREMIERLARLKDAVWFSAKVTPSTPSAFFDRVETSDLNELCTWDGELYLELHNGTYTSQADMKRLNRRCEVLLRDCEMLAAFKWMATKGESTGRSFESEWKSVLLNQFHDVLPGSSIGMVYDDARRGYQKVIDVCDKYFKENANSTKVLYFNSLPWNRLVESAGHLFNLPACSYSRLDKKVEVNFQPVKAYQNEECDYVLENDFLISSFDGFGRLKSLRVKMDDSKQNVDFVADGQLANEIVMYDDVPLYWDAWDVMDYHLETRRVVKKLKSRISMESSSTSATLQFELEISAKSHIKQKIVLRCDQPFVEFRTKVHWHEAHKMLKVDFPINVRTTKATYEIQFGHLERATHRNTSWDSAKFEVCAQKWADLSEYNRGVALLNDSKYGYSCHENVLTLSLLRSPKAPDANADMGAHQFTYAVMPHFSSFQRPDSKCSKNVIQCAYELNTPIREISEEGVAVASIGKSYFRVDSPQVIIEAVKMSECGTGVVVRLYECFGGRCSIELSTLERIKEAQVCDLLERKMESLNVGVTSKSVSLSFTPFQIVSVFLVF